MNKRTICLVASISLFCSANFAFADSNTVSINNPLNVSTFSNLLANIATQVGTLITTLGTIMLIVAGILYLTSAGNPEKINKAKTALTYAIIGIVIGIAASTIVSIIKTVIGVS